MRAVDWLLLAALACAAGLARADARPAWAGDAGSVVVPVREASGDL